VRVDGDRAFAEDLHKHDVCRLAADAGESLERFAIARDFAVVLIDERL